MPILFIAESHLFVWYAKPIACFELERHYRIPVVDFPPSYSPHGDDGADELTTARLMPLVSGTLRMRKIRLAPLTLRTLLRLHEIRADFIHQDFCKAITTKVPERRPWSVTDFGFVHLEIRIDGPYTKLRPSKK